MVYTRKISVIEFFHAASGYVRHSIENNLVNQWVIEGHGGFDERLWREALRLAAAKTPGCRLVKRGLLGWRRWEAVGPMPPLTIVRGSNWDGRSGKHAPFLDRPLDIDRGPTAEVVLVEAKDQRAYVVLRTHHATMDGAGTTLFLRNLFKALNHQALDVLDATITDKDIIQSAAAIQMPVEKIIDNVIDPVGQLAILPRPAEPNARSWRRITFAGGSNNLLARCMLAIAAVARKRNQGGHIRFVIPTDLRRHCKDTLSTANLTGMMIVDFAENESCFSIKKKIAKKLKANEDLFRPKGIDLFLWIPIRLMSHITNWGTRCMRWQALKRGSQAKVSIPAVNKNNATNLNSYLELIMHKTALVSSVGFFDKDDYSCAGFDMQAAFAIPVNGEIHAFTGIASHSNGNEMLISFPARIGEAMIDEIVAQVIAELAKQ